MTTKKIYIAEDGTEFASATECEEYEVYHRADPIKDFRHKIKVWQNEDCTMPLQPKNLNNPDVHIFIFVTKYLTDIETEELSTFLKYQDIEPYIRNAPGLYIWDYAEKKYDYIEISVLRTIANLIKEEG